MLTKYEITTHGGELAVKSQISDGLELCIRDCFSLDLFRIKKECDVFLSCCRQVTFIFCILLLFTVSLW